MVLDLMPQLVEALGTLVAVERALAEQGRLPSRVGGSDAPLGQIEAVVTGAVFEAVDLFTRRASRIDEMASLTFLEGGLIGWRLTGEVVMLGVLELAVCSFLNCWCAAAGVGLVN